MSVISPPDCYSYIIGLYNGDCECYPGKPDDFNVSDSGLYISDLLEPAIIDGLLNCDQGASIWELMEIVRELAIKYFIGDTNALLMKEHKLTRVPFRGAIGRSKADQTLSLPVGSYAGVRMYAADVVSGYLRINKIGTIFDTTGTIDLYVYDNNGTLIATYTLNTTANQHELNTLPVPLELPLHDAYLNNLEYFFVYQVSSQPRDNELSCNCERWIPCFDVMHPYWGETKSNKRNGWANFLMVGGLKSTLLPDFTTSQGTALNKMYGLTFDVELGCKVSEVLCMESLDYEGNTLAQSKAIAIQKKSAALFIDKILSTPNINRPTMLDHEDLLRRKTEYETDYASAVNYIAENVDITVNDCLECRDLIGMVKGKILA